MKTIVHPLTHIGDGTQLKRGSIVVVGVGVVSVVGLSVGVDAGQIPAHLLHPHQTHAEAGVSRYCHCVVCTRLRQWLHGQQKHYRQAYRRGQLAVCLVVSSLNVYEWFISTRLEIHHEML